MNTISDNLVSEVAALEELFNAGELTTSEYTELLKDLQSTKVIEAAAGDIAILTRLNGLINGLIAIASLI
jgi:hypothetical protein